MTTALPVFTPEQRDLAHRLLALRVARMMGRKLEEADWSDVYAAALGMERSSWSNLGIDVMHRNLGVEQKALRVKAQDIAEVCGKTFMHPALTRSIRVDAGETNAELVMARVFTQYAQLVDRRRTEVDERNETELEVEMRSGWLLWQESLKQFLYFEEPMHVPVADNYTAEWHVSGTEGGRRKPSRNLWIFDKNTGQKRYSVTTEAGAKIQPYFDVPLAEDPNLYIFTVTGEPVGNGNVRVWLTRETAGEMHRRLGSLESDRLEEAIRSASASINNGAIRESLPDDQQVVPVNLPAASYDQLVAALPGGSDDQRFRQFLEYVDV